MTLPTNGSQSRAAPALRVLAERAIEAMANGENFADACSTLGVKPWTVHRFISADIDLQSAYVQAQRCHAEILAEEVVAIADDVSGDPQHNRNRMAARQWWASKTNPKFSDKLHVEVEQRISLVDAIAEAKGRALLPGHYRELPDHAESLAVSSLPALAPTDIKSDSVPMRLPGEQVMTPLADDSTGPGLADLLS